MTPKQIQNLRQKRGETCAQFAAHFAVSSRTVQGWEQGRAVREAAVMQLRALALHTKKAA